MVNRHRGDVPLEIGGDRYTLRLTLGGLAELEDALGGGSLAGLGERLSSGRIGARDFIGILRIGLAGGGHVMDEARVSALAVEGGLEPIMRAVAALFANAFGTQEGASPQTPQAEG
jgi:hypothetical protein